MVGSKKVRFQDGGVTPYNNPALLLFSMATQPEYNVRWKTGAENILVVSIGTGLAAADVAKGMTFFRRIMRLPAVFMNGASIGQDYLCRAAGTTTYGLPIDREAGRVLVGRGQFTYARYNVDLGDLEELREELARLNLNPPELLQLDRIQKIETRNLVKLNAKRYIDELYTLGRLCGYLVDVRTHFAGFPPL